tara:strand:+ start:175 stop:1599 length:1425 start_codon:yes stop_codon:yes gene_type:complete
MARFDLILSGGTVLDPANSIDSIADIGIKSGRIRAVAPDLDPYETDKSVDVTGKWVMPGQIDTHAHVAGLSRNWDPAIGYGMLAKAGTTTVLDMGGTGPNLIDGIKRRGAGLNVAGLFAMIPGSTIPGRDPVTSQLADIVSLALQQGCIGIKMLGGYHPFSPEITSEIIRVCNDQLGYIAFHLGTKESGSHLNGLREIPDLVGDGRLHVCHVNSYCRGVIEDADDECDEALDILEGMRGQLNSEAYHAVQNGTSGSCDKDSNVIANVPQNCLRMRNYPTTREGMRQAILDGYASVVGQKGGQVMYIRGKEALDIYETNNTHVGMSFPVNLPASAFKLATAKNSNGEFIVDAVSTDGGSHPRNVAIQSTMALVKFRALSRLDMANKLSLTPARMLGLQDKGHFTEGADADITVLDPSINEPVMSFVAGEPIMINGQVVGSGGRLMVTPQGEAAARESGLLYQVLDLSQSKLYDGY